VFWLFAQIVENILPFSYYSDMIGVIIDCTILFNFLKVYQSELIDHLNKIGCEKDYIDKIIFDWFINLFTQGVPNECNFAIWDMMFLEGDKVLFKAALGIFNILKKDLKMLKSFGIYN